ncbi:MAG: ammonium transporter [Acholeplasmatales bacterium]|nr:ammonium transporter [Acholeplasmatales bacterium]
MWDYQIWKLIAISLIFFMQAGFAMCEAGFTRAKNTGNIVMKNLMDFCLGTVTFILIGGPILCAENAIAGGLLGSAGQVWGDMFTNASTYNWTDFIFNLVFCATTATIVSGAMAERTNFKAYCIYSMIISAIVYPVEAYWNWGAGNNGWLQQLAADWGLIDGTAQGFIDLSGSCSIHMVGGLTALIGAWMVGPRIGKYTRDENGKVVKINAIQGHNILMGALGVFILWFGWYGFNPAACTSWDSYEGMGQVFMTTTIAAALSTVTVMIITWVRNGKPDVSMTLNGSLAGLVAITAGCSRVDLVGSVVIGIVAGVLLCFGVEFIDKVLHIDDPVGACSVHFLNGLWGTLACGLFSTTTGLFYGHGFAQLGIQLIGIVAVCAWTAAWAFLVFGVMKLIKRKDGKTPFLRATPEEEIRGLDITEHGLISAYPDFVAQVESLDYSGAIEVTGDVPVAEAVSVTHFSEADAVVPQETRESGKFTKIEIICKERMLDALKDGMLALGINGMTVSHVMGCGQQKGSPEYYRGVQVEATLLPKIQVDIVVGKIPVENVIDTARKILYTGHIGDGKIFVYDVLNVVKVRTGEKGYNALEGEE